MRKTDAFRFIILPLLVATGCSRGYTTAGSTDPEPTTADSGTSGPGPDAAPPQTGCTTSADCEGVCNDQTKQCAPPTATDAKRNNGESDVDCGGATAPKCAIGKACRDGADCYGGFCPTGACVAPTHEDGAKNAGESDIDCGGVALADGPVNVPAAARCALKKTCAVDADCGSSICNKATKVCVQARSCGNGTAGISTCGQKEVDDPTKVHDSCCTSLPMPTRGKRLDKYEVTAGRFRQFIGAVGPDVRSWAKAFAGANPASQLAKMGALRPNFLDLYPASGNPSDPLNVVAQLGAIAMDNYSGIRGCYNGYNVNNPNDGAYGHATYWLPPADLAGYGVPPRVLAADVLDAKSMNCVTAPMFVAFCAWDGGELASVADYNDVWTSTYPWGAVDTGRPNYNWCNSAPGEGLGGFACGTGIFYEYPKTNRAQDISPRIGAPGRFPNDLTTVRVNGEGWYDLFANLLEYTGDFHVNAPLPAPFTNDFCDFSAGAGNGGPACTRSLQNGTGTLRFSNLPSVSALGHSFEGHALGNTAVDIPSMAQYGKLGGRCVRPL